MELLIIIIGVVIDQFSKVWAIETLSGGRVIHIIRDFFDFEYLENRGAAFGIFQGRMMILGISSLIIVLFLFYHMYTHRTDSEEKDRLYRMAVALVISGAVGNLIDRFYRGFVVDFIHLHLQNRYHFPTFNIADTLVVVGAGLLLLQLIIQEKGGRDGR